MDVNLKNYFRYFRFYFLAILILALLLAAVFLIRGRREWERTNGECDTTERVFDNADVLTDGQEEELRELIARKEKETGCDIVLVTLNESLAPYVGEREGAARNLPVSQYVMIYADDFYDSHRFGYDEPCGDGVLLVDNWYRESDGNVYSWLSTCGRAETAFSSSMIDRLLTETLRHVDEDPYEAYRKYITLFAEEMERAEGLGIRIPLFLPFAAALAAAGIFVAVNLQLNRGMKTTNLTTYLEGRPQIRRKEDIFLRKTVSRRRIERSQGSGGAGGGGGGGHHISGGGVSHGGGGHAR